MFPPKPASPTERLPKVARRAAAIAAGWVLCECLVRVLVPVPIFYSTWFTEGVHERDTEFGFVFTPSYVGAMRHPDGVWMEPLSLDHHGMRKQAGADDAVRRVVMLGGASMAFSFGLSDRESLHYQTARLLDDQCSIQILSWPGFTLGQDLRKLARFCENKDFDQAVVFAYSEDDYRRLESLPNTTRPANIPMLDGVVLPNDPASKPVGDIYYRSLVVAGVSRWVLAAKRILGVRADGHEFNVDDSEATPFEPGTIQQSEGLPAALLAAKRLRDSGIERILVVALPHQLRLNGPASLPAFESTQVDTLDLRTMSQFGEMDWIAGGHYGPASTGAIAKRIAVELEW